MVRPARFAALNAKTSEVITQFHQRHRSAQFREFLDLIEAHVPRRLDVHIIMDNYGTQRAGVKLGPPRGGRKKTRQSAASASRAGRQHKKPSPSRLRGVSKVLKREPHHAASRKALARQARSAARRRPKADRRRAARKAAKTRRRRTSQEAAA